jgi:hypothetical protein
MQRLNLAKYCDAGSYGMRRLTAAFQVKAEAARKAGARSRIPKKSQLPAIL